jgi:hypothetical protein
VSVKPYAKAVAALAGTVAAGVTAALLLGSPGDAAITTAEWISIASTTLIATVAVFLAPANAPAGNPEPPLID